ncbi:hypothetical protein [Burkholderia oklahomensis]|uniref:hypothetical protein n=1 Tax=Burkholderia oklahomensis TaxID=342113 RepID=UPI00016A8343|nr:hypothetical protein [Burkholderia oklahomensis]AJX33908.1 hypothetical protein BG90_5296 [Burkholderia oklahomensis C6786]AOI48957.1 hypothetical protein WI23_24425 [Burkholderia oklahomensis C6786]KUY50443.1 hypothetical protein WI23_26830 [Burkholderia oklahomensis C6786]MBI0362827.1 hypothetical protein [Burkholderia oklahomensis]SUY26934.1 Uncharacterised protein [Burkholderia oklahomensis]
MGLLRSFRAWRKLRRLPSIKIETKAAEAEIEPAAHAKWAVVIRNAEGARVGEAIYGLSQLTDRLYVHSLEIAPSERRRGYALAFLMMLNRYYKVPIVPMGETPGGSPFWVNVSKLGPGGLAVLLDEKADGADKPRSRA